MLKLTALSSLSPAVHLCSQNLCDQLKADEIKPNLVIRMLNYENRPTAVDPAPRKVHVFYIRFSSEDNRKKIT